jgi:hypothetical protein
MIHELRRYTIKPGKLAEYVEKSGSIGRPIRGDRYGKLLGYWSTELGPLNQVVHLWEFADLAARTTARAGPRRMSAGSRSTCRQPDRSSRRRRT